MSRLKHKRPRRSAAAKKLPTGPHGGIELLLVQAVDNLGDQGDVVEVRPGYAKNYLLPQGYATLATDHHKRMVERHKTRLAAIREKRLSGMRSLADALGKQSVTVEANVKDTQTGEIYGSVGQVEISKALRASDFVISPEQVRLKGPLKELGLYTVQVHVGHGIEADLKVWVVPTVGDAES